MRDNKHLSPVLASQGLAFVDRVGDVHITRDRHGTDSLPRGYSFGRPWGPEGRGSEILGCIRFQDTCDPRRSGVPEVAVVVALIDRLRAMRDRAPCEWLQRAIEDLEDARYALNERANAVYEAGKST